jgi:Cu-Zn family superoxide dismutase
LAREFASIVTEQQLRHSPFVFQLIQRSHHILSSQALANLDSYALPGKDIHDRQNAKCDPPDFKSAGPHFNPDGKKHGLQNPDGHHAGDMINFTVNADGKAKLRISNDCVNLGSDNHSLFSNGGTALVVHAKADDMKTDPAGNAGDRIACGVIKE